MSLYVATMTTLSLSCSLWLVPLQLDGGGIARSVRHTLILVDEETVGLDDDLFLQHLAVILQIFEGSLAVVESLHERIDWASNLVHLANQTETQAGGLVKVTLNANIITVRRYVLENCSSKYSL